MADKDKKDETFPEWARRAADDTEQRFGDAATAEALRKAADIAEKGK